MGEDAVLSLPEELQSRIIENLDFKARPNAALACKAFNKIVNDQKRSARPSWSSALLEGEPKDHGIVPTGTGASKRVAGATDAARALLASTRFETKSSKPDVLIVTATPIYHNCLKELVEAMLAELPSDIIAIGCLAHGIIGTTSDGVTKELDEDQEGLAVALIHLPGCRIRSHLMAPGSAFAGSTLDVGCDDGEAPNDAELLLETVRELAACEENKSWINNIRPSWGKGESIFTLLIGDSIKTTNDAMSLIMREAPKAKIMGGLCGYRGARKSVAFWNLGKRSANPRDNGPLMHKNACACLFIQGLPQIARASSYRGIKQVCENYEVISSKPLEYVNANRDVKDIGYSVEQMRRLRDGQIISGRAMHEVYYALEEHGHINPGLNHDEATVPREGMRKRGIEIVSMLALHQEGLFFGDEVCVGDVISWYVQTADESIKELQEFLASVEEQRMGNIFGYLLVICNARGTYLHNRPNAETAAISAMGTDYEAMPAIGFFANGEIGPPSFREYQNPTKATQIHGFTSVLGVFQDASGVKGGLLD